MSTEPESADPQGHETSTPSEGTAAPAAVDQGTYELLRDRLLVHARSLRERAEALNAKRLEIFGATELRLASSERIRTENNCVSRDILAVGDRLLFGYNVFLGLRTETKVEDVLTLHRFRVEGAESDGSEDGEGTRRFTFEPLAADDPDNFLADPVFVRDFSETYRYYKDTRLQLLRMVGGKILAVFQTGASATDVKVFRWAIDSDHRVSYIDNRGERDHVFPASHDFEWTVTDRDDYVLGRHPHVSILDQVFVETVGGDLTVKVEDNTEDGHGIYREPVDEAHQTLADAEVHYAKLGGLILLKVRPYNEKVWRYLVFNTRNQQVDRIDAIGRSCVQLPEDHGLIFPGGYYLQDGSTKTFDLDTRAMELKRVVRSPNGEDVLYIFHQRDEGRYVLLPYNLIRKQVQRPIQCHGFGRFDDGWMVVFRADSSEPTRVHAMQVMETPFVSEEHAARIPAGDSFLETIGNADLVRGISDALSLVRAADSPTPTAQGYEELTRAAIRTLDAYPWLGHEDVLDLATPTAGVRETAEQVIGAFAKVEAQRRRARTAVDEAANEIGSLIRGATPDTWKRVDDYVAALAALRQERGRLVTLGEMRYADTTRLESLRVDVEDAFTTISGHTVEFLLGDEALAHYRTTIDEQAAAAPAVAKLTELVPIRESIDSVGDALELLTEVVGGLAIDDATVRTRILERISEIFAQLNRARALVEGRRKALASEEGSAEFAAQFQLFDQQVSGAIGLADTPEACDEALAKLMVQLEDLEARFGELDDAFLDQLTTKREDVYEALSSKKQALQDARQRKADRLWSAADRIFEGIGRRTASLNDEDALNAYFAGDAMVAKLREIGEQLRDLGDAVRSDELASRLKAARQDAGRTLRDRRDLYEDGAEVVRLGRHRFSVNQQPLALTMVPRRQSSPGGGERAEMAFHLTGTDYYTPVDDPDWGATRDFWNQLLVSETAEVYRGEFLAYSLFSDAERGVGRHDLATLLATHAGSSQDSAAGAGQSLEEIVRGYASDRYDEGYERGVHDHDAAHILGALVQLYARAGLLRFPPRARAVAYLFWAHLLSAAPAAAGQEDAHRDRGLRDRWRRRAQSLDRLRAAFTHSPAIDALTDELATALGTFAQREGLVLRPDELRGAGRYLFEELAAEGACFVLSAEAVSLRDALLAYLDRSGSRKTLLADLDALDGAGGDERDGAGDVARQQGRIGQRFALATAWLEAFVDRDVAPTGGEGAAAGTAGESAAERWRPAIWEAAALVITEGQPGAPARADAAPLGVAQVDHLLGQHGRIRERALELRLDAFLERLGAFREERVPAFRAFQARRHTLLEKENARLRLGEFTPRVMSAFVRNRLIDEVYLPLIGDNLAKQLGALGDSKRTDQMGLLLLISPPGYGKTTLMEYVASRLGMTFVKINGPALGHAVTSVDPAEAPNATARQEVEKISFGLEMGNNVLLYLDDIQHTNPELLQKFIALCDAQRRMEGVWRGETRTYDLRGKRFAVVMAGNPYTESGETFRIPDMLANRADTYNLGDILSGKDDLFALSYLENSLTSSSALAPLAARDPEDVRLLVKKARGETIANDSLKYPYDGAELEDILAVLRRLLRVQQVLLAVNRTYISSASQADAYRTEPPFLLQGSYRNMNKLTERIVPEMNDSELEALLDDHYQGEAQALTTGAEANLLKLRELRGVLSDKEAERWDAIKRAYVRQQSAGGDEEDPTVRVIRQLGMVGERLEGIDRTLDGAAEAALAASQARAAAEAERMVAWVAQQQAAGAADTPDAEAASGADLAATIQGVVSPIVDRLGEAVRALAQSTVAVSSVSAAHEAATPATGGAEASSRADDEHLTALRAQTQQLTNRLDSVLERMGDVLTTVAQQAAVRQVTSQQAAEPQPVAYDAAAEPTRRTRISGKSSNLSPTRLPTTSSHAPAGDFAPYLDRLDQTLAALAERPAGGVEVVQRLGPGVVDLLGRLGKQVEDGLLPLVQSLSRRLDTLELENDRGTSDLLDRSLKRLDELRDLVGALQKIDTARGV